MLCWVLQNGSTPLHITSQEGHAEIATLLIECGAKVDKKNKVSAISTILHLIFVGRIPALVNRPYRLVAVNILTNA